MLRLQGNVIVTNGHGLLIENCDDTAVHDNLAMALKPHDVTAPSRAMFVVTTSSTGSQINGNAAAGSAGPGFMFVQPNMAEETPSSAGQIEFTNNTAHSNTNGLRFQSSGGALTLTVARRHRLVFRYDNIEAEHRTESLRVHLLVYSVLTHTAVLPINPSVIMCPSLTDFTRAVLFILILTFIIATIDGLPLLRIGT